MRYAASLIALMGCLSWGCGSSSSPTSSTPTSGNGNVVFTAQLLAANETPPITGTESTVSGTATITFVPTRDSSGNITSAVATAVVTLQGFPAGSTITLAHIHTGAVGVAGPVLVPFIPSVNITPVNGGGFSQTTNVTGDQVTGFINNPAGFYFNVHTAANPGGVMRGQIVLQQ